MRIITPTTVLLSLGAVLFVAACGTSNPGPVLPLPSSFRIVVAASGAASISAPAGAADPGSAVSLAAPGTGSGTVAADGSVAFSGTAPTSGSVGVNHVKSGAALVASTTVIALQSRLNKSFAATGAGSNDLLYVDDSLYVAASLDNKLQRFGLDGALADEQTFPVSSSPSYIEFNASSNRIWVTRNGDNIISGLDAASLDPSGGDFMLDNDGIDGLAFAGPGRVQAYDFLLLVPMAAIGSFGSPTVYDTAGIASSIPLQTSQRFRFADTALNGQEAEIIPTTSFSAITSAGEIQFDDDFVPSAVSDSMLTIVGFSAGDVNAPTVRSSLALGQIGASSIAIAPDGQTAYLGNLINGNLYKLDLSDLDSPVLLRGSDNPIQLTDEFTYISDVEFTPDGSLLLASSFNTDELFVIDPATDTVSPFAYPGPLDMRLATDALAGCQSVETDGDTAWVLYAIGNAVAAVDLF